MTDGPPPPTVVGDEPTPVPELALRRPGGTPVRDVLYRVYVTVLFTGVYGGSLAREVVRTSLPRASSRESLALALVVVLLPLTAGVAGVRVGRWAGPVPVTPAEVALLLPSPVDRTALLVPRLRRAAVAVGLVGLVVGLVISVLVVLARSVSVSIWVVLPLLALASAVVAVGASAIAQSRPVTTGWHRRTVAGLVAVGAALVGLGTGPLRPFTRGVGDGLLGSGQAGASWLVLVLAVAVAAGLLVAAERAVPETHDEQWSERAGLHAGLAASASNVDLRAIALSSEPGVRRRRVAVSSPRGPADVVAWRYRLAVRTRPGRLVRCAVGWGLATVLVASALGTSSVAGGATRAMAAAAALYWAVHPVLEPLRREHDRPLAAELLPLGTARIGRMHLRAGTVVATAVGLPVVALTVLAVPGAPWSWWVVPATLAAGAATSVIVADRLRRPSSLADAVTSMPGGLTPDLLGLVMARLVLAPLLAMVAVVLPVLGWVVAPAVGASPAGVLLVGAAVGGVLVAGRLGGWLLWLRELEESLADGTLPASGSTVALITKRLGIDDG